ncbi:hypothetical protein KIPB_015024, partial [Kipferlia bialata]|eukprot:g15024.t1
MQVLGELAKSIKGILNQ